MRRGLFPQGSAVAPAVAGITVLAALAATACGPSLRMVEGSRHYFERCYSADFDARTPIAEKHACWESWLAHYRMGQPSERRRYARNRLFELERGVALPRLPGMAEAAIGPRRAEPLVVSTISESISQGISQSEAAESEELPGLGHAGERSQKAPDARPRRAERRTRDRPRRSMPRTSNRVCAARACEPSWQDCVDRCGRSAQECVMACRVELSACSRSCF